MKCVEFFLPVAFIIVLCSFQNVVAVPPMVIGNAGIAPFKHWELWCSVNYREMKDKRVYKVPTVEFILGVIPRVEMGIEGTYIAEDEDGDKSNGLDSLSSQTKFLILEEGERLPAFCASLQYEVPMDEDKEDLEFNDDVWSPSLAIQKHFGDTLLVSQGKYYINKKWRYGVDVMYAINKHFTLLAEIYAVSFIESNKKDELNFRLGFKYKIAEWAKVYFAAGRSLVTDYINRPKFDANVGYMIEF